MDKMKYIPPKITSFSLDEMKKIVAEASTATLCIGESFACRNKDDQCSTWDPSSCGHYDNIDSTGGLVII